VTGVLHIGAVGELESLRLGFGVTDKSWGQLMIYDVAHLRVGLDPIYNRGILSDDQERIQQVT
jgi:hypothetical protein